MAALLRPLGIELQTLADFSDAIEVEENGSTFGENARLKATVQAQHLSLPVIGEDSGIVVDALDGAPGIYSARFAGLDATDEQNNQLLLEKLADLPLEKRTAHYVCHITISNAQGEILAASENECHGRILFSPVGSSGFGYDPLFQIQEYHHSFGELGMAVKSCISHRARAIREFLPQLSRLLLENRI